MVFPSECQEESKVAVLLKRLILPVDFNGVKLSLLFPAEMISIWKYVEYPIFRWQEC